jgi:hypothetical protein
MHHIVRYCLLLSILISYNSCNYYQYINIQVLNPAEIKLGTNIDRMDIHCLYCGSLTPEMEPDSESRMKASVSLNFLHSLQESLEKSPILEKTDVILQSDDSIIQKLADIKGHKFANNCLIVLDSIFIQDVILGDQNKNNSSFLYAFSTIDQFDCKLYKTSNFNLIDHYKQKDTLYWSQFMDSNSLEVFPLLPFRDRIWDAGIKAGEKYAHHLAPYWSKENRLLFSWSHKSLRKANKFMMNNQLDSANQILSNILEKYSTQKVLYSNALHNYAVLMEMQDRIDEAIQAETQSVSIKKYMYLNDYLSVLRRRKLDKIALDWQLAN